jgi:hypothetical protein
MLEKLCTETQIRTELLTSHYHVLGSTSLSNVMLVVKKIVTFFIRHSRFLEIRETSESEPCKKNLLLAVVLALWY